MRFLTLLALMPLIACGGDATVTSSEDSGGLTDSGPVDADDDGYTADEDCDDNDPSIHPFADEYCDDIDSDCDGQQNEDSSLDATTWYLDEDGDGYGLDDERDTACDAPEGYVSVGGDCDDDDTAYNPGAAEEDCTDPEDYNCDGEVAFADVDEDGWPACEDCNDDETAINPDAIEVCDGVDNDCDTLTDDDDDDVDKTTRRDFYPDDDGDGFGDDSAAVEVACTQPADHVEDNRDCNDADAAVNPDATEVCDGSDTDEDCNGVADDDDSGVDGTTLSEFWLDGDKDGYGAGTSTLLCDDPSTAGAAWVEVDGDCDDASSGANPGATEICDPRDTDEDCDGAADDDDDDTSGWQTWYADADGDGYGDADTTSAACDASSGWVSNAEDCDDSDTSVSPDATETWYDGIDQDCDALSDYDADQDGYAYDAYGGTDCDDTNADISPAATETWYDGTDQDCDAASDWDADADGHDSQTYGGDDCDDHDASVNPSALEADADKDNDCDGDIEAMPTASATYDTSTSSLLHCDMIQLDGSGSADDAECAPPESSDSASSDSASPDTGSAATCPLTYSWTLDEAPASSARTTSDIAEPDDESPIFYPDVAGDYAFSLVVTDEGGAVSETESFDLTIGTRPTNSAPTASAGDDQTLTETSSCSYSSYVYTCDDCSDASVTLDSSSTSDADSDQLTYAWAITAGDKSGELDATDIESPTLTVWGVAAEHDKTSSVQIDVELTVTDCYGTSSTDTVSITYTCTGE